MKAARFDYLRPQTLSEASGALAQDGAATAAIAGGQSLIPMLNLRVALPDLIVDLSRLDELKRVEQTAEALFIGALTTHAAIEDGKTPDLFNGLMRRVAGGISYRAVRNYGTIGGSVALADPAADWPGCLMALGAVARISGPAGERSKSVTDVIDGAYETSLAPGEIILGFQIPLPTAPLRWGVAKVARKSGAFALSIAIAVDHRDGRPPSIAVTGAGSRARLFTRTTAALGRNRISEDALRPTIAADIAEHAIQSDEYLQRLHTATVLRAIKDMRAQ